MHDLTLQVVPELRNYHLKLLDDGVVRLIYFTKKYDLDETFPLDTRVEQMGPLRAAWVAAFSRARTLDIFEPLWVRNLPWWILIVVAWKIGHLGRGAFVVSYCMENNSLSSLLFSGRREFLPVLRVFKFALGTMCRLFYSRLAFASPGAKQTYDHLGLGKIENATFISLPARRLSTSIAARSADVVFVGRFEVRKGILQLLQSWSSVLAHRPDARLRLIGSGPLKSEVENWVRRYPSVTYLGELDHGFIEGELSSARILVLPSLRDGRWREQIGLPILEGLAAGCTIVTSDETGLAEWLAANGHFVYQYDSAPAMVEAILAALAYPLDPEDVLASLPVQSTREEATRWVRSVM